RAPAGRRRQPGARRQEERRGPGVVGHRPQVLGKKMAARLKEKYAKEVAPALQKEFGIDNVMAIPRLEKIVLNMGLGEAVSNPKMLEGAAEELSAIAGQRANVTKAKKSIATYKLRTGMPIGARVTLRGARMCEFLDRLINIALPRVRDFRGVSTKAFDGRGNYTLGVRDHFIFPEIDYAKTDKSTGLNVTIVTTAGRDDRAKALLRELGMPFAKYRQGRYGHPGNANQGGEEAEVHDAHDPALPGLRPPSRGLPQVRPLPHLFPSERQHGIHPGRPEGVVVKK